MKTFGLKHPVVEYLSTVVHRSREVYAITVTLTSSELINMTAILAYLVVYTPLHSNTLTDDFLPEELFLLSLEEPFFLSLDLLLLPRRTPLASFAVLRGSKSNWFPISRDSLLYMLMSHCSFFNACRPSRSSATSEHSWWAVMQRGLCEIMYVCTALYISCVRTYVRTYFIEHIIYVCTYLSLHSGIVTDNGSIA